MSLEVSPIVTAEGIILELTQRNDEVAGERIIDGIEVPDIITESLDTRPTLADGQWEAVGGIKINSFEKGHEGWKWLWRVLPNAASKKSGRLEIGVYLRASVVRPGEVPPVPTELYNPSYLEDRPGPLKRAGSAFGRLFKRNR